MDKEQRDAAIRLLSEYERIVTENLAMQALLEVVQKYGAFKNFARSGQDSTWKEEVAYLLKSVAGKKVHELLLPFQLQIEQAFQDAELSRLLAAYPQKGPPN